MSNEQLYNKDKHKYLNNDVLELGKKQLNCSKETRYEIIYKETLKKLNKMCINEIYHKVPRRDLAERRASKNTLGLLEYFDSKLDKTQQRDLLKS